MKKTIKPWMVLCFLLAVGGFVVLDSLHKEQQQAIKENALKNRNQLEDIYDGLRLGMTISEVDGLITRHGDGMFYFERVEEEGFNNSTWKSVGERNSILVELKIRFKNSKMVEAVYRTKLPQKDWKVKSTLPPPPPEFYK
ncbi:hypothetical protein ACFLY5_00115 [Patescibacteria group bacterium]